MLGWHVAELAKDVAIKPRHSQAAGRATLKAVRKHCTLPLCRALHSHIELLRAVCSLWKFGISPSQNSLGA